MKSVRSLLPTLLLSLLVAPAAFAQFQTCVFCDVMPFDPDPFMVQPCETATILVRGAGYQDTRQNGCSNTPTVGVRSTRTDRLVIDSYVVQTDGRIRVSYTVPCDAPPGLVGIDVTIDDDPTDTIVPYACGNARIEVQSLILAVTWDGYAATRTVDGVDLTWTTLSEEDTLAFEVRALRSDSSEHVVATVPAHGPSQPYRLADQSGGARDGSVEAYRIHEIRWDGRHGDATPWFKVERGDGDGRTERASGGRNR